MDAVIENLVKLGLSQYESRAYVALLAEFPAKPYQVGKRGDIPTAKIYEVMNRLEERGLAVRLTEGDRAYIPQNPARVFAAWETEYRTRLKETQAALDAVAQKQSFQAVWNIDGADAVIAFGQKLLRGAKSSASLIGSADLLATWEDDFLDARTRGVFLNVVYRSVDEPSFGHLGIAVRPSYGEEKHPKGTVMAVDGRVALFIAGDWAHLQGAWTENAAIVSIAEEAIADKLFIEKALRDRLISWGVVG